MSNIFHSVTLVDELCKGCTHCIKRCPTDAIRVRNGKAKIMDMHCIDCGECIRICPYHAKKAVYDTLDILKKYKYNIALLAPSLYGQFPNLKSLGHLDAAFLELGFDAVFEVSKAAEIVSDITVKYIKAGGHKKPIINSACPTITRLIQKRFPDLIEHLLPIITPSELSGLMAKAEAAKKTGLNPSDIGTIFISPCPAKITTVKNPIGIEKSYLDGAIGFKEIYPQLHSLLSKIDQKLPAQSGGAGIRWGASGGEASAISVAVEDKYLAADGIENCIQVLESLENEQSKLDVEYVELNACPGGCVGGVLTVANPFVAMVKLNSLRKKLPTVLNKLKEDTIPEHSRWSSPPEYQPVMELDNNILGAMEKLSEIDSIEAELRGLDCGSCGSPSCRAFAEDVVRGYCEINECIFILRESMQNIAETVAGLRRIKNATSCRDLRRASPTQD